jgi:hypothetical protein
MAHKRLTKNELLGRLHVGLRPKLTKSQVQDLGLAHIANLDTIARDAPTEDTLWQWIGGALTWSYVATVLEKRNAHVYREAAEAMRLQLEVAEAVVERYGRTSRIGFSGPEYLQAKEACEWMDALAEVVDQATASRAADWSEARINQWSLQCARREEASA